MTRPELTGIHWVRLSFVDVFGTGNSVQIPATRYDEAAERGTPFDGSALEGRARYLESDMLLRPVPATLVELGDGIARVVCTAHTPDGTRWTGDPRFALESLLDDVGEVGEQLTVAAELEFFCSTWTTDPSTRAATSMSSRASAPPSPGTPPSSSSPAESRSTPATTRRARASTSSTSPRSPRSGSPTAWSSPSRSCGTGPGRTGCGPRSCRDRSPTSPVRASTSTSAWRAASSTPPAASTSKAAASSPVSSRTAAGLSGLAAPTVNSYKRLHAGPEAPGAVVWAHTNRAALLRVSSYRGPDASIEYRGADPSANPYLLLAGLLAAGIDGLERGLELPSPAEESAHGYDPTVAETLLEPLPRSLDDALDALLADDVLVDTFDDQLLARLVDGRQRRSRGLPGARHQLGAGPLPRRSLTRGGAQRGDR